MKKFLIVTDSCSDLDKELRNEYDIEYIPMHYSCDGVDYDADLDWQNMSVSEFYNSMRNGKRFITAQVNVSEYKEAFTKYINDGYDVLSISCSSALSASVKASRVASEEIKTNYPDSKIICIDSLMSCAGLGIMCIIASKMRAEGKSIEEVAEWIENNKLNINQEATVDKLLYLRQAGRVSAASAFFGGLLSVKPIIISDVNGQNVSVEKVKGRKNSIARIAERVKEEYVTGVFDEIFVYNADCIDDALEMKKELVAKLGIDENKIRIGNVGPILGASCGPGMMGVYFYGKKVTYDSQSVK